MLNITMKNIKKKSHSPKQLEWREIWVKNTKYKENMDIGKNIDLNQGGKIIKVDAKNTKENLFKKIGSLRHGKKFWI